MRVLKSTKKHIEYMSNIKYKLSAFNVSEACEDGRILVYNTYSGALILMKENELMPGRLLAEQGIFVPELENELQKVIASIKTGENEGIRHFTILPTTRCNAACFYCYEGSCDKIKMSDEVIEQTVEYILSNIADKKEFILDWYGGEPLLCTDVIDHITDSIVKRINTDEYEWKSIITTNATLFTEAMVDHAVKNWNLQIAHITIDGIQADHNRRKGFENADFDAFAKTYAAILFLLKRGVYVNLRIHLDKNNAYNISDILSEIQDLLKFDNLHLYITPLFQPTGSNDSNYYYADEKEGLFYKVYKALLGCGYCKDLFSELPKAKTKICSATNTDEIVIAPDGGLHRCVQEFEGEYDIEKFNMPFDIDKKCTKCAHFPVCLGGCIHNKTIGFRDACTRNRYIIKPLLRLIGETMTKTDFM